jgi:hypothetical protein
LWDAYPSIGGNMKLQLSFIQFVKHLEKHIQEVDTIREFEVEGKLVQILLSFKTNREPENIKLID